MLLAANGHATNKTKEVDDAAIERLRQLHYTESEQVRLVLLPTSVTDRKGRVVRGLERRDFRVYEDQQPQEIRFFSSEARDPISIAFMLDVSGSMRQVDKLLHAKEAIRYFVEELRPEDRFALICFADDQVAWVTDFTNDRGRFLKRLEVQYAYGQTALNDAVAAAPGLVDEKIRGRKAIVLITDGVDNFSRMTPDAALDLARQVSVPIYTVGFLSVAPRMLPKGTTEANLESMTRIAEGTGGKVFPVSDPVELKEAITYIEDELRFQYVIGYYPSRKEVDGEFRAIKLEASRKRWNVRTRSGYYASH